MKTCSVCGQEKPLSEFYKRSDGNGYRYKCKACSADRAKGYYQENKEEFDKRSREWAQNNVERRKEIDLKSYYAHHEERKEAGREYARNNRERDIEKYHKDHEENPSRWRKWWRDWNNRNREKCKANYQNYKARKKGNGGKYTSAEWLALCEKYGNKCLACGKEGKLTVDHIVPLSLGGTNDIENIQPLCLSCNSSKGNRVIKDYR